MHAARHTLSLFRQETALTILLMQIKYSHVQNDRLDKKRQSRIGTIEITRCEASYVKEEYREIKGVEFHQATKKDAFKVTEGKYTMSTTKKGRYIHRSTPYDVQLKKLWRVGPESSRLTVQYRMGHTLKDMGIVLRPIDWSKVIVRRRSSASSGSASPPTTPPVSPTQASKDTRSSSSPKPAETNEQCEKTLECENDTSSASKMDTEPSCCEKVVEPAAGELSMNYSTVKIKEEPKDVTTQQEKPNITHIQLVAS